MRSHRFFIALFLLLLSLQPGWALQLGDSRDQIEARYDTAPIGNHPKGIAIYQWDLWKLEIQYSKDVAFTLIYTKLDPMSDDEISTILDQNGGRAQWQATASPQGRAVAWTRSDGATAAFDAVKETLTLSGGRMPSTDSAGSAPAISQGPGAAAAPTASQPGKPEAIAPALKKPGVGASPAPKPALRPAVAPPGLLSTIISTAVRQKMVWFGIALIVAALVLQKRGLLGGNLMGGTTPGTAPKAPKAQPFPSRAPVTPQGAPIEPRQPALQIVPTLENIGWQRFELLIGEVFRRKGYQVEVSPADGADGGVDLRLRKDGALVLAQCKCYMSGKVSVQVIREFYGVIAHEHAARGIFVNTSAYTQDALKFAEGKEIELLDAGGVNALINSVTRPGENIYDVQGWLGEFTAKAEIKQPVCPFCKKPMVLRNSKEGANFWGCTGFPGCNGTREARTDLVKELINPPK